MGGGEQSKCPKKYYYKSSSVTIFVQNCSLISIYNGMYTVFSVMIHLNEQVRLVELHV